MGMFDYIRCEMDLPGPMRDKEQVFQTKDLHNEMVTYVITTNGEIYQEAYDIEWENNETSVMGGHFKRVKESFQRIYLTDINQDIIFYDSIPRQGKSPLWVEYVARFQDGKLTKITYTETEY